MSTIVYTSPEFITGQKATVTPRNTSVSGYGGKIPTRYMLEIGKRWHRVYMMQYGNSGSPYVLISGVAHHLDTNTEHDLQAL